MNKRTPTMAQRLSTLRETKATIEPTDRSICPAVMTKVIATPTMSAGATWVARLDTLLKVRKLSSTRLKKTKTARVTPAMTSVALLVRVHHDWGCASRAAVGAGAGAVVAVTPSPPGGRTG